MSGSAREGPYEQRSSEKESSSSSTAMETWRRTETYKRGERVMDAPEAVAVGFTQVLSLQRRGSPGRARGGRIHPWATHRYFDEAGHLIEVKVFRNPASCHATGMLDSLGRRSGEWTLFWKEGMRGRRRGIIWKVKRDGELDVLCPRWSGGTRRVAIGQGHWHGTWKWYHERRQPCTGMKRYRKGKEDGEFVELVRSDGDTLARGSL